MVANTLSFRNDWRILGGEKKQKNIPVQRGSPIFGQMLGTVVGNRSGVMMG